MNKLKFKTEKIIDVNDWDKLVEEVYGRPYSFQQQDGCKDRGIFRFKVPSDDYPIDFEEETIPEKVNGKEMGVSFKAWLARDPKQPIKDQLYDFQTSLWWRRNFYPCVDMIIQDLFQKGLIEKGEYVINIDW